MRKSFFLVLSFLVLCQLSFGQITDVDYMEQVKRNARVNSHIEKQLGGKIIQRLYKGVGLGLYGFIFRSDLGDYYHVSLQRRDGTEIFPHLTLNQRVEVMLTGDAKLLEEILYYTSELITLQNKLDIRLKGLAHLKSIRSDNGTYIRQKSSGYFDAEPQETFQEDVRIVRKKKHPGNRWAYIMENEDTLLVPYDYDDLMKDRTSATYFKLLSTMASGVYYKSPKVYQLIGGVPFRHERSFRNPRELMVGRAAVVLDKKNFTFLEKETDDRGMFNGIKAKSGDDTLRLLFNPQNGELVQRLLNQSSPFEACYKQIDEDKYMLYSLKDSGKMNFLNNSTQPFSIKNNYSVEETEYHGEITKVEFGKPISQSLLTSFVINDSIFVQVNQVVALNIQKMVNEGKKIGVKGWLRKEVPGEVNLNGYSILAATAITIGSKTFKQLHHDIKKTL